MTPHFGRLPDLSPYTFGSASTNDPNNPQHIKVIRRAMESGVWFHSAEMYGKTYETLRKAFDEAPTQKPPVIIKVHGRNADELRRQSEQALSTLGLDHIQIAQICERPLAQDMRPGSPVYEMMKTLQQEGKVGSFVLEFFRPSNADDTQIVEQNLFDGYIFYYNIVDREVSNLLWDKLLEKNAKILALRTLGGGPDTMGYTGERTDELQFKMRARIEEIFRQSGCVDKLDFRLRFSASHSQVVTTIGGTSKPEKLEQLLTLTHGLPPLPPETLEQIAAMHREYFIS